LPEKCQTERVRYVMATTLGHDEAAYRLKFDIGKNLGPATFFKRVTVVIRRWKGW